MTDVYSDSIAYIYKLSRHVKTFPLPFKCELQLFK